VSLGGRQEIPRPSLWRPGGPPPWSSSSPVARSAEAFLDRVREVYTGRIGAPAAVEADPLVRRSAVLSTWYVRDGEPHVLCTRRAWNLRTHRGEVSFPGGGEEPGDEDLRATARREAWEEVHLEPGSVEVVGELDHLTTVSSDRSITPVVGLLAVPPAGLVAQESEVEEILEVPLASLLHPDSYREERWGPLEVDHPVVFFEIEGDTIWGATAAMLRQFLTAVLGPADRR
jgi:8-oxo-dGTP pyrophosphatase MutT (NUDIX family)